MSCESCLAIDGQCPFQSQGRVTVAEHLTWLKQALQLLDKAYVWKFSSLVHNLVLWKFQGNWNSKLSVLVQIVLEIYVYQGFSISSWRCVFWKYYAWVLKFFCMTFFFLELWGTLVQFHPIWIKTTKGSEKALHCVHDCLLDVQC